MKQLTAIILTRNEEAHIIDCIDTLHFADEIIVYDSFSDDQTVVLAREAGAVVMEREFDHYAGQRNAALEAVQGQTEWVLFVDADERIPPALAEEILSVLDQTDYAGWRIPRHNYIFGKLTMGSGWYPDYQIRLLRSGFARFDPQQQVHEVAQLDGQQGTIEHPLIHYNYRDISHFLRKQRKYTAYDARILYQEGIHPEPQNYILQPLRHFWWRFVTLKGYTDGLHGLRLCGLMSWYELRKYLLLRSFWKQGGEERAHRGTP